MQLVGIWGVHEIITVKGRVDVTESFFFSMGVSAFCL